ncbi:MAG: serine/threonine-protein kinase [Planctomycetota bacterium]
MEHSAANDPAETLPVLGQHQLIRKIGSGGMGVVFAAEDLQSGRKVALKVVADRHSVRLPGSQTRDDGSRRDRFQTEIRTIAELDHPHIVTLFTADRKEEFSYYTMKLINGIDLHRLICDIGNAQSSLNGRPIRLDEIKQLLVSKATAFEESLEGSSDAGSEHWSAEKPLAEQPSEGKPSDEKPLTESVGETDGGEPVASPERKDAKIAEQSTWAVSHPRVSTDRQPSVPSSEPNGVLESNAEAGSLKKSSRLCGESLVFFASRMADVANAIAYANEQGVLHRDIKPSNLIIDRNGKIFVTDFGLAKWVNGDGTDSTACVGTRGYIAPECFLPTSDFNPASEVYSIGCVLHQLMTLGTHPPGPVHSIAHAVADSELPSDLATIVFTAMAAEPTCRYENVAELASELRRYVSGEPLHAVSQLKPLADDAERTSPIVSRRVLFSIAAISVACLALVGRNLLFDSDRTGQDVRAMAKLAASAQSASQKADETLELFFESFDELYLPAAERFVRQPSPNSKSKRLELTDPMRKQLELGVQLCERLLEQPGHDDAVYIKVASLLRRIAFVFESGGATARAAKHFGLAAAVLERLGDEDPQVLAERYWLQYLQTRRQHFVDGYKSQAERYRQHLQECEQLLERRGLDVATESKLHELAGLIELARERFSIAATHLEFVQEAKDKSEIGGRTVMNALLTAYRMGGQYQKALPLAEQHAEGSENDEAWRNLAGLYLHLNRVAEATAAFDQCVKLNPNNALGWHGKSWAAFRAGKTEDAIRFVNKAESLRKNHDTILSSRAAFLSSVGRWQEAAEDYRAAINLRPDSLFVAHPAIMTLLFWAGSADRDVSLCSDVLRQHSARWPAGRTLSLKVLCAFRQNDDPAVLQLTKTLSQKSPLIDLIFKTSQFRLSKPGADRERLRTLCLNQLADPTGQLAKSELDQLVVGYVAGIIQ